jgi:3-phenylpropionate/trans-cinnamate dioxygenase ferredoxin reductase subunit
MAGGRAVYARVPWFWSQQYELKMQSAGLSDGHDQIVECGDRSSNRFALKYLRKGQLIGIDAINMPAEYLAARKSIAERVEAMLKPLPGLASAAAATPPSATLS